MNCPRCRGVNPDNANNCQSCGIKLKLVCPKCKAYNNIGVEKCGNCNLRLITFCPNCKAPNHPIDRICRKCNFKLLKQCQECKAINPVKNTHCFKCSKSLNDKIQQKEPVLKNVETDKAPISKNKIHSDLNKNIKLTNNTDILNLEEYTALYIEIINLADLKTKLNNDDIIKKIVNKFYRLVSIEAKQKSEKFEKIKTRLLCVKFKKYRSIKASANNSIELAQNIINELNNLNYVIYKNFGLRLKIKIASIIATDNDNKSFAKMERSIAKTNDIIISKEFSKLVADIYKLEKIGPIVTDKGMTTFFKIKGNLDTFKELDSEFKKENQSNKNSKINTLEPPKIEKKENTNQEIIPDQSIYKLSQEEIYNYLFNQIINAKQGALLSISAPDGAGKTTITNSLCSNLSNHEIIWLLGSCSSSNQFIPYSYMQDMLKTLFNLPTLIFNVPESKTQISKIFESFGINDTQTEKTLFKLLFQEGLNTNIYESFNNKNELYTCFNKIISALNVKSRIAIFVDDFEFIDRASLEYLQYLISNSFMNQGNSIIINHLPQIDLSRFFTSYSIVKKIINIELKPLSDEEINTMVLSSLNNQDILPENFKNQIYKNSKGLPIYIEQALWLLFQKQVISNENDALKFNTDIQFSLPDNIEDLTQLIISDISSKSSEFIHLISQAAILGQKFVPCVLQLVSGLEQDKFNNMLEILMNNSIFIYADNQNMTFKHKILWRIIFERGLNPEQKINFHNTVLEVLKKYIQTNSSTLALHAEMGTNYQEAISLWNDASIEALSVGDIKAYSLAQERVIMLIDKIDSIEAAEKEKVKINISEQLGKINHLINPQDGVKYLFNAISQHKKSDNQIKVINLSGYLAKSWSILGNYNYELECVNKTIAQIDQSLTSVDMALLNYAKLEALFNLGKLEEAIILAKNNIIPVLNDVLNKNQSYGTLGYNDLIYILLDSELILTKALAYQGNKETLITAEVLINKATDAGLIDIVAQAKIASELFIVLQGKTNTLNYTIEYLNEISPKIKDANILKLNWDFINLVSGSLSGNNNISNQISQEIINMAESIKEYNIQSIAKLLTGLSIKNNGQAEQAKNIYYDVLNYCSENKLATGALLGWYLIAKQEFENENINEAQDIAEKALDIAQKSTIKNHFFTVLLQKLIAEVKIIKGDFEMAYMLLNQGIEIARAMNLYSLEAQLLLTYSKMYHKLSKQETENSENIENNIKIANQCYNQALEVAKKIENNYLISKIEKEASNLNILSNL